MQSFKHLICYSNLLLALRYHGDLIGILDAKQNRKRFALKTEGFKMKMPELLFQPPICLQTLICGTVHFKIFVFILFYSFGTKFALLYISLSPLWCLPKNLPKIFTW